ncbi:hypothetical protein NLG97_g8855 [Lecanicillium saksenae]|uniref:Uncharacterized protein n=1 Tax=Lecanicillium saksenae TaxID=468837 RepID=A0ACC1QJB9_9HYPO|nr:hypothetical protein NLG97_g8855 [Lecanicillium saksenae]
MRLAAADNHRLLLAVRREQHLDARVDGPDVALRAAGADVAPEVARVASGAPQVLEDVDDVNFLLEYIDRVLAAYSRVTEVVDVVLEQSGVHLVPEVEAQRIAEVELFGLVEPCHVLLDDIVKLLFGLFLP